MNSHQLRIFAAAFVAVLVFTALLFLAPLKTPLLYAGFACSCIGIMLFFGSVACLAQTTKKGYVVNSSFVFVARTYAVAAILFSLAICITEQFDAWTMPLGWFLFVHILFAALLVFRLVMLASGADLIEKQGESVDGRYSAWKMILADAEAVLAKTPPESRKDVSAVCEAIRYADPMSAPAIQSFDQAIRDNVVKLSFAVSKNEQADIASLSGQIQDQIKDRANRLKSMK